MDLDPQERGHLYRISDIVKHIHPFRERFGMTRVRKPRQYTTDEAAKRIGCSRSTLLRWFREGKVADVARDRRGWRIFSDEDIIRIRGWASGSQGALR